MAKTTHAPNDLITSADMNALGVEVNDAKSTATTAKTTADTAKATADAAYVEPPGGIPVADLAAAVLAYFVQNSGGTVPKLRWMTDAAWAAEATHPTDGTITITTPS